MDRNKPTVSIGLPVYNGEKYLKEALDSILAQTYRDFELIISDNASTDRTQQICQAYAAKDKRIRYYRNKKNVGGSLNFNRTFELASGKYFKWAAHDDVIAPEFLSKCVNILDQDPSIVLCHSKTGRINENGKITGNYAYNRVDSSKPDERFSNIIDMHYNTWVLIFGVIRSSALKKTQLFGNFIGVDRHLLAELSLIGRIYEISDYLFFRREHPQAYTNKGHESYKEKMDWWIKTNSHSRFYFPHWRICLEYFKSVKRIPLKWSERLRCTAQIIKWLIREGWIFMVYDVGFNLFGHSKLASPVAKWFFRIGGIK